VTDTTTSMPRTRAETLAARLERRIQTEQRAAGDYVGTLDELRTETGFARSTVSEAVRLLRERGIIEIRPGRGGGLFVAATNPVVRLRHTLLTVRDAPTSVVDAIAVRDALEGLIAQEAARHRTQSDIDDLRGLLHDLVGSSASHSAFMRANWRLHERIAAITPNAMASAIYLGTLGHISTATSVFDAEDSTWTDYFTTRYAIHDRLVTAIIAGDATAVTAAVQEHNTTS
jgi:GntR family transcriptional repressor for pyruvate dehydrogenase complex